MPWLNMIVNVDGDVTPCCYWTTYGNSGQAVGNVNDGGLLAAWNSPGFVAARTALKDGVEGTPCEDCMAFKTGGTSDAFGAYYYEPLQQAHTGTATIGNLRKSWDEYLAGEARLSCRPTSLTVVTTASCNIDCTFCNQTPQRVARMRLEDGIVDEVIEISDELTHLAWQGGEALLDRRFSTFLKKFDTAANPNLVMHLVTNGLLATPDFIATCVEKFQLTHLTFSIDSFDKATYERVRRGASFDKVMNNLACALEVGRQTDRLHTAIQGCIMKSTVTQMRANLEAADRMGVALYLSPVLAWPPHEALNCFNDFATETVGWQSAIDDALDYFARKGDQSVDLALNAKDAVLTVAEVFSKSGPQYSDLISIGVEVATIPTTALGEKWPVVNWDLTEANRYVARVLVQAPTYNLVNAEYVLTDGDTEIGDGARTAEGRYGFVGGVHQGENFVAVVLDALPGHDPRCAGKSLSLRLRPLAGSVRRRRHGRPILAVFNDLSGMPPPIAHLNLDQPGRFSLRIPRVHAHKTLGCYIIDDEAAFYSSKMNAAGIEQGADGTPVIRVAMLPEHAGGRSEG